LAEIEQAVSRLASKEVVILHGFQGYPTLTEANQIARVQHLCDVFRKSAPYVSVGFADHALPDTPLRNTLACVALGAGARVFEKHLTLGKVMKLEDHESALNPDEFQEFCSVLRESALALGGVGSGDDFGMSDGEKSYRGNIRRHVVSRRELNAGTVIVPSDVALKRTSAEQPMTELAAVYQKQLRKSVALNQPILAQDIH
jgi:sialic acid synthase SpsE